MKRLNIAADITAQSLNFVEDNWSSEENAPRHQKRKGNRHDDRHDKHGYDRRDDCRNGRENEHREERDNRHGTIRRPQS